MSETEAIKVATLHLDGEAQDWWFHGMVTLGHSIVTTYAEVTRRLIKRFDWRDSEQHFVEMTRFKQIGNPETYIADFLRVSVMVLDLSAEWRIYTFVDGAVNWMSKKQSVVALSTTEAEYMAATHASKEAIWLQRLCSSMVLV